MANTGGTSSTETNRFDDNLTHDVNDFHIKDNQWTHARNAINNSRTGDIGKLGNEPSNLFCTRAPYTIIGTVHLYADKWAIFSTDDTNSEIGLFVEDSCTYTKVVNAQCLSFNKKYLIKGVSRATTNCLFKVYWDDGFNPSRALEFDVDNPAINDYSNPNSPIPWIQDCGYGPGVNPPSTVACPICNNTPDLDCDKIRLARFIQTPCVEVKQGIGSGTLLNGSYMVAIAYSIEGNRVSDYYVSNVQPLFNHENNASSLDVFFSNLDQTFQEIEVVIVYVAAQNAVSRLAGYYSTRQQSVSFDGISNTWETVPLDNLVLMTPIINRSDAMYTISDYLIRSGTVSKEDFNYQPLANQIVVKWQSVEYPINYYRNGGNKTNYMRDEVYAFFIRWIYDTGDKSPAYHIPGRSPFASDFVFNTTNALSDELTGNINYQWLVENTAFETGTPNTVLADGGVVIAEGLMGYWESTEEYPDNRPELWNSATNPLAPGFNATSNPYNNYAAIIGQVAQLTDLDLCGEKIRHHRFPELYTSSNTRYLNSDATKIRIMGVQFENIKPPLKNDGITPIPNIVGYEIMRGTRNGNKSILAKGIIKNMQKYRLRDGSREPSTDGYFVNYPYNDLRPDPFLVDSQITGATCSISGVLSSNNAEPLADYSRDVISFHSPDTSFQDPFLSAKELKVVGEVNGDVTGQFDLPEKHPKEKLITNFSFLLAFLSGLGLSLLAMNGKRRTKFIAPKIPGYSESNIPGLGYTISYPTGLVNPLATSVVGPTPYSALANISTSPKFQDQVPLFGTFFNFRNSLNLIDTWTNGQFAAFSNITKTILGVTLADPGVTLLDRGIYAEAYRRYNQAYTLGGYGVAQQEKQVEIDDGTVTQLPKTLRIATSLPLFLTNFTESANSILDLIKNLTRYKDFALRYHSHGFYNRYIPPRQSDRRFSIENAQYLGSQISTFDTDIQINNLYRSRTVAIKLNKDIQDPQLIDVTKIKASNVPTLFSGEFFTNTGNQNGATSVLKEPYGKSFGPYISPTWNSSGALLSNLSYIAPGNAGSFYANHPGIQIASSNFVSLKQRVRNQYGQIGGVTIVPASYCSFPAPRVGFTAQTSTVFGGDTYVTRYTEKNTFFYFYDWLYGQADGAQLDYKKHQMIPYARYFANFEQFETGDFVQSLGNLFSISAWSTNGLGGIVTPSDYYALDGVSCLNSLVLVGAGGTNLFRTSVKNQWFYLFNSGVIDFFTESEINVDLRDWGENDYERHYDPYRFTDTKALFDAGIIKYGNYYKYDYSLSIAKLFTNYSSWTKVQPASYSPYVAETCYVYNPTRVIYSLPEQFSASFDNWATFLPNNYYDFTSRVSAVKPVNKSGALFFFEDMSPLMFQGLDQLQTTIGTALTIGDGKLFSQPSQNIINTERPYEYASCQDRLAVINTPAGIYWMSQNQGKIFNYSDGLAEVSMQDIKWWLINFLPSKLLVDFPDFELVENPVIGIGCQSTYDNQNGLVYFCKRDFKLRTDLPAGTSIIYQDADNFIVRTEGLGDYPIKLGNPDFFEDASWTISFDPKTKGWVSYHDWHPNLTLPGKNTFLTTKDDGVWIHNYRTDSYCNYYGKDYPWEVEYMVDTGVTVNSLRSIEYQLECYKYAPNMYDRFHVLDYNFDHAVVYNTEQVSGFLNLYLSPKKDPMALMSYPKINFDSIDVLFSKEENRYRFNQFWDITADRGEYNPIAQRMIWNTAANGYVKTLNPNNMDYYKDPFQRKKFRHYTNSVFLRRNVSGDKKMLIMITNNKNLYSPR